MDWLDNHRVCEVSRISLEQGWTTCVPEFEVLETCSRCCLIVSGLNQTDEILLSLLRNDIDVFIDVVSKACHVGIISVFYFPSHCTDIS